MMRAISVGTAAALLAACTPGDADGGAPDDVPARPEPTPSPAPSAPASGATSSGARAVSEETDDFLFEYSYPAEAGAIPELATLLDQRLERLRTRLAGQAARGRQEARDNGFPYNKYSSGMEWQVVADLPDWLSLSGQQTSYMGGAHGNYGVLSLVWNKAEARAMRGIDLFASPAALTEALGERYCEALDALRAERRTEPLEEAGAVFEACPSVDELTVLVGSSNGRTFDRLTLYAGPYVAGPYVEGAYEVDLPVDEAVLAAVRPEYRESFAAAR